VIEGKDTASEAHRIASLKLKGVAAIAGKQVAEKYGLQILDSKIQKIKENRTRFVVISKERTEIRKEANKASLKFVLDHEVGSLSNVLQLLSTFEINLTKIQSVPILGSPWKYAFFVDVLLQDPELFENVIDMMKNVVKELKIIGVYPHNTENAPSALNTIPVHGEY
jgi:prephenate dehydratase